MRYDKTKLQEKAKPYFENPDVNKMFVTEDGNLFYENAANYAKAHSKHHDFKLFTITREDYKDVKVEEKKESKPETETKKESGKKADDSKKSPREVAKELGLTVAGRASDETIQKMIDEHLAGNKNK